MSAQSSQAVYREQLAETLVSQLTHVARDSDVDIFSTLCATMRRTLRNAKTGTVSDMFEMDNKFKGLIQKARIKSQDDLANALEHTYSALRADVEERLPMELGIKMATLPDHLQFLICLSLPPAPATHTYASIVLDKAKDPFRIPSALTWETIIAEEPFEGQHWEKLASEPHPGKGKRRSNSWSSSGSGDVLTGEDDLHSTPTSPSTTFSSIKKQQDNLEDFVSPSELAAATAQMELDDMLDRQYWKEHWRIDVDLHEPFDLSKAETLGPTLMGISARIYEVAGRFSVPSRGSFINEVDAVREVLLALQGLDNNLLVLRSSSEHGLPAVEIHRSAPLVVHLTSTTYFSLLTTFASAAVIPSRLHHFLGILGCRWRGSSHNPVSLTAEAFAQAVDEQIRSFRSWCSDKEHALCIAQAGGGPSIAVSLLSLSHEVEERISILSLLLDIVTQLHETASSEQGELEMMDEVIFGIPPLVLSSSLLDLLFAAYKTQYSLANEINAKILLQIFVAVAQPIWKATSDWLLEGKSGELRYEEDEVISIDTGDFFVRHDGEVLMSDPSFWRFAYTVHMLPRKKDDESIPAFLRSISADILAAGKAKALLIALEHGAAIVSAPRPLSDLLVQSKEELWEPRDLEAAVRQHLLPMCLLSQQQLYTIVVDTCRMWHHLAAIEDLYLFRRGDVMDDFADALFTRLDTRHIWFDFHAVNATFRDLLATRQQNNVDASLVRFWYTKPREDAAARMTRCLSGLSVTYEVPVPLLYLLTPDSLLKYSTIFALVMQVRRAKRLIDNIIVRRGLGSRLDLLEERPAEEMKNFFGLRSKLGWFLNTLTYFLYTTVIQSQLQTFHKTLEAARNLDEMIKLHDQHLESLSTRCLLSESTASLHRALLNVLDIALRFGDCYNALSSDPLDGARRVGVNQDRRKGRTRRQRRHLRKQDFVGYAEHIPHVSDSESSDSDVDEVPDVSFADQSMSLAAVSFADENLGTRVEHMSNELDKLVRYIRRGAEKLGAEGGQDSSSFEALSFSLCDWDL
ncbi:hypothetical protein DACRYDRAFT_113103 [Dacryopinax primogenitus]|uniref:Spindle pole body component n=1 Tax=Dacryopinax primogenitus (strain DJM 731) TaxID=1858805 RepID=M5GCS2_DACPD|nr:uncharacterized protein DACRYDRAFT_113103 [Dacryopinax primogenitus]EJU06390.1 hypothetical protein DACRYDRAFT_113103 [Dacryopinax primogenitus]